MNTMRQARGLWGVVLVLAAGSLNTTAQQTTHPVTPDFASFKLITERNIFNADRSGGRPRPAPRVAPVVRVDTFTLVGILTSGKGAVAFINGSSSGYRRAIKPDDEIGNCKVAGITADSVKLTAGEQQVEMKVGMQMRREDEGEWQLRAKSEATSFGSRDESYSRSGRGGEDDRRSRSTESGGGTITKSGPSSSSAPPGVDSGVDPEEVLRRLMEQREAETQ